MNVTLLDDVLFKVVFGTQRHSEALRGLLNAILGLKGDDRISEITLLNPLRDKEHLNDKGTILDVKARDGLGRVYNVEVQVQEQLAYRQRSLFYAANMISGQVEAGQDYRQLKKTIHISLMDFVLFDDFPELRTAFTASTTKTTTGLWATCSSFITSKLPSSANKAPTGSSTR